MLSFLQQRLDPSTLKVYIAAISAHHDPVDGKTVGKLDLVARFLGGESASTALHTLFEPKSGAQSNSVGLI